MKDDVRISKTLSYWLRHHPEKANLTLNVQGWASVDALLMAFENENIPCTWEDILRVVEENDKQRFELSSDAGLIRARQGHSVTIDLNLVECIPPSTLYHGTVERFLPAIMAEGLKPMQRHHVHLSENIDTATRVGARRGTPVVISIAADNLYKDGHAFFVTENKVWLTDHVPAKYILNIFGEFIND